MGTRLNSNNYAKLDFLINNFYEIVEFKRGRGIYGDRVILKRPRNVRAIFGEKDKMYDFYYLDANDVSELPRTTIERINIIKKFVVAPESMNVLCDYNERAVDWAIGTSLALSNSSDFRVLNNTLINRYKLLNEDFLTKLNEHRSRQYLLASSESFNLIEKSYADEQLNSL